MARLEKVDRDRLRLAIKAAGGYVRTNVGNAFVRDRPDLQGVCFVVEMKREGTGDLWGACTKRQQAELAEFAAGDGRACVAALDKSGHLSWAARVQYVGPQGPSLTVQRMELGLFVDKLLGKAKWWE